MAFASDRGNSGGQQLLGLAHVLATLRGFVKLCVGGGIRHAAAKGQAFELVQDALGLWVSQQHRAVCAYVGKVVRGQRVAGVWAICAVWAAFFVNRTQAKNNAGCNICV